MTKSITRQNEDLVFTAITGQSTGVISQEHSTWRFTWMNGVPYPVSAKLEGDWLCFQAEHVRHAVAPDLWWSALERNAALPGLAKIVLAEERNLTLRAELPLVEGVDLPARVRETSRGFDAAKTFKSNGSLSESQTLEDRSVDLKALCTEAGWPFVQRGEKGLAVELEVSGSFRQALLFPDGNGVRIACELASFESLSDVSRQAIAKLLLNASAFVRMVRASVSAAETSSAANFEAVFASAPTPQEIAAALNSLSVACSICGEELLTLQTPAIAERFLQLMERETVLAARPNERTKHAK
jgi:hypothetical protein